MIWWFGPASTDPGTPRGLELAHKSHHKSVLSELLRSLGLAKQNAIPLNNPSASSLLRLPPELRDEIYRFALLSPGTTLSLLTTSHQLKMEAQPLLYQRPIKLSSQAKLFDWIKRRRNSNLRQVKNLTLRLTDIDLSPLLDPENLQTRPQMSAWTLYNDEIARLDRAFWALPALAELTIIPPRIIHSQLLRGLYLSLLALIPEQYPRLRLLVIHDESAVLKAVAALQGLPKVTFKEPATPSRSPRSASTPPSTCQSPTKQVRVKSPKVKLEEEEQPPQPAFLKLEDMRARLAKNLGGLPMP